MSQYNYLRNRIENNAWLGKEILTINDFIYDLINATQDLIFNLPPIAFIRNLPPLAFFRNLIENCQNLTYVTTSSALIFLETAYGINRAFNSQKYLDLQAKGNQVLSTLTLDRREISIYENVIKAHNQTLDIAYMAQEIQKGDLSSLPLLGHDPFSLLQTWQETAISRLINMKQSLEARLGDLEGKAKEKAKRTIYQIKKVLKSIGESIGIDLTREITPNNTPNNSPIIQPRNSANVPTRQAVMPIRGLIVGTPSIPAAVSVINEIANFLLSNFLLKPILNFPAVMIQALTNCVTGMVLKFMGGAGAIACRYFSAATLRANQLLLPAIFRHTGMGGAAYAWLGAYAPYIIIAAILIIVAIQSDQKLGEFLYIFGLDEQNLRALEPDVRFTVLGNSSNQEIYYTLINNADDMVSKTGKDYQDLTGFSVDNKGRPVIGLDLLNNSVIGDEKHTIFNQYIDNLDPWLKPEF